MNTQTAINNLVSAKESIQGAINSFPVFTNKTIVNSLYALQDNITTQMDKIDKVDKVETRNALTDVVFGSVKES